MAAASGIDNWWPMMCRFFTRDLAATLALERRVLLLATAFSAAALLAFGGGWLVHTTPDDAVAAVPKRTLASSLAGSATRDSALTVRNGDWIAYSTVPHGNQAPRDGPDYLTGSDVFLVRQGHEPILVAGRGDGETWNVCPAFSPDGTKLAFSTKSQGRLSVSVVRMTRAGVSAAGRVDLDVIGRGNAPCPMWSTDGSRLTYVRAGKVVVRGLDGSTRRARAADPVRADFRARYADSLTSPAGDLVARREDPACVVIVERPDGSGRRALQVGPAGQTICPYAVAAWSPDGRRLLVMFDTSGRNFTMIAVAVNAPFKQVPIVEGVRVNHARSWPGRGDVSWQPRRS